MLPSYIAALIIVLGKDGLRVSSGILRENTIDH